MKNYEFIEHTADIGIRVRGGNLKALFANAASAMFEIIAERRTPASTALKSIKIAQQAENLEELFINWLNELLSLSAAKNLIFSRFTIGVLDNKSLQAVVSGEDAAAFKPNTEIKAATYHQLKLEEDNGKWMAEVIFDV
ncbi:MAG: archease [Candidatus Omnitrophica bacterium]|nr:archease [Candidatus Omnitrophota bacterium]